MTSPLKRTRSAAAPGAGRFPVLSWALAMLLAWCGCSSESKRPEDKTVKELLEENSTLLVDLASYESSVRNDAAERLRSLGREQGTAVILHLLHDPSLDEERVEIVLARILASWQDRRAIPYLLQFLNHPDQGAMRNASEGLLEFGADPRILEALEEMLASEVVRDRRIAAETLRQMKGQEVVAICVRHFKIEEDNEARAALLVRILNSRAPERKRVLIEALDDPFRDIRELAWGGLHDYKDLPAVSYSPAASPDTDPAERERNRRILYLWEGGARQQRNS